MTAPQPPPVDLQERVSALASKIITAEDGLHAGHRALDVALEEAPRVVYARRYADPRPPQAFRRPAIDALLHRVRRFVLPGRVQVPARFSLRTVSSESGDDRAVAVVETGRHEEPTTWRLGQVYNLRYWGVEFRPPDDAGRENLEGAIWRRIVSGLSSDISSIARIEDRFADREITSPLTIIADDDGEAFERLLVDVINGGPLRARLAPLYEDFLEKTDLRVDVPGLKRKRGVRVQVSMTADVDRMLEKRAGIRSSEEFVLLSPWTIAEALVYAPQTGLLPNDLIDQAHHVLGSVGASTATVASSIRSLLTHAIKNPGDDLNGPVGQIPASIRALVQAYVAREAVDATRALRTNEAFRKSGRA